MMESVREWLGHPDDFARRHIGPSPADVDQMLGVVGCRSLDALIDETIPESIRVSAPLRVDTGRSDFEALASLRAIAQKNRVFRSFIGMGYYDCIVPPVIQRSILENPGWYTQYTPYQAEIAQGRLEALINFQTMVADLTGLPLANASLLDEATAAAEAMHMCRALCEDDSRRSFFVAADCHPQTIAVVRTRAKPLGIELVVGDPREVDFDAGRCFGVLLQFPTTDGRVEDYRMIVRRAHDAEALVVVATDLLALTLLTPPGEWGADIAVGSAQRFGVPLGGGGPHAAFMSCRDEYKRQMPGRIIGVSRDSHGNPAYRLAIQTREQHIRREKATSNICTAQVLLAVMAGMYAVYHGPHGLRRIARRVHAFTAMIAAGLENLGHDVQTRSVVDTLRVRPNGRRGSAPDAARVREQAEARGLNFRYFDDGSIGIAIDETLCAEELPAIFTAFGCGNDVRVDEAELLAAAKPGIPEALQRRSPFLTHPVFNRHHCEHEMLRYIRRLESRDLSLTTSMISLGSCTMKLNAAAEMYPVSWPEFARMHPFAPADQQRGYAAMFAQLEGWLAEITGFPAVSLQPNAGSQGEYAGLLAIRAYHESRGESHRDVCLIPASAHGTNPASAVVAGFRVVGVRCDDAGNIDLADLKSKATDHAANLGAIMVTYPSTHGVFEEGIRELCAIVHQQGGQVYMDGANMNAQVGLTRPADIGADVCHLNLHKTFCIPHGGGGPGMGPIAVAEHLAAFLPTHPLAKAEGRRLNPDVRPRESAAIADRPASGQTAAPAAGRQPAFGLHPSTFSVGPISAAPFGSPSILPISWMYIRMMGGDGLRRATQVAILNANYMSKRLEGHFPVLFRGQRGRVAHEFIIDLRPFEESAGVRAEDVAKRLMDYGFHAPTMSFPVPGTLMIEPTESESRTELDRFCDAMIAIREEIREIEQGRADRADNALKHAPHTAAAVAAAGWTHAYSRDKAAYPAAWLREHKFWPAVGRIDNVWGDRHLFCTCVAEVTT
ncbi:MAG: aminomethyl-transferring glycine dehydrogenase [Phycisphaerae bacterium]